MRLNLQADCCSPGKPEPCLHLTLPISFHFTKAFPDSWLHAGSLNTTIPISWSPEIGGSTESSFKSVLVHFGLEPLSARDPVGNVNVTTASSL